MRWRKLKESEIMKTGSMGNNAKEVSEVRTDSVKTQGGSDSGSDVQNKTTTERVEQQSVEVRDDDGSTDQDQGGEG